MCPLCDNTALVRTIDRNCTLREEIEVSPEGVLLRSRGIVAVSPASGPARVECPRCGHAWWERETAPVISLAVEAPA
jgi:hypothetical protein